MAASEELYGEGHPATYDPWEADNPLYDPESKWYDPKEHKDFLAGKFTRKVTEKMVRISQSDMLPGYDPEDPGVLIKASDLLPKREDTHKGRDF